MSAVPSRIDPAVLQKKIVLATELAAFAKEPVSVVFWASLNEVECARTARLDLRNYTASTRILATASPEGLVRYDRQAVAA